MKYKDIDKFILDNGLLQLVPTKRSGIYCITIDDYIAYVGQSRDLRQRCSQHIYNIENAMCNQEKKYLLLLSAKLGGHKIDCETLAICPEDQLNELEDWFVERTNPCLYILTPHGKQDIKDLKIENVLERLEYKIER